MNLATFLGATRLEGAAVGHPAFWIDVSDIRVRVIGEVDLASASKMMEHVFLATCQNLDLSGVTFIDSTGLHALIRLHDSLPGLRIIAVSEQVQRLLDLTDTADYLGCGRAAAQT